MQPPANPSPNKRAIAHVDAIEDEFGGRVTVAPNDGRVVLRGWALDAGAQALAAIDVDAGGARATGPCTVRRPDVAATFGAAADTVGFRVELALGDAAPGHHAVVVHGQRLDGSRVRIPLAVGLDVVPALRRLPPGLTPGDVVGFVDEVAPEAAHGGDGAAVVVVPADGALIVRGWAASPGGVPATLVYAELDRERFVRGMTGYPRPDVAAQFGTEETGYGFRIRLSAHELGAGERALRVHAIAGTTIAVIGGETRVVVAGRAAPRVFEADARLRGRIDLVGRLDDRSTVVEERFHLRLKADERAVVTGWAGDPIGKQLPTRVMLVVDGVAHGPVQRGIERDDVAAATASEELRASGFSAVVRADALETGFHRAELVALYDVEPVVFDAFSFEVIA